MEYKLLKQTVTTDIYNVGNAFYLIIPKIMVEKKIKVVIDTGINTKLDELANTSTITIARPFSNDYFNNIDDIVSRQTLKSLITKDLQSAKEVLNSERKEFVDEVVLSTPYEEFKEWYFSDTESRKKIEEISINKANPEESYKSDNEDINATIKLKQDLLELRKELIEKSKEENGSEKGHRKVLSNGKSTLKSFDDGFINIIFLSLVTLIVTLGTMLSMFYIMR